jgi:hypothetical protein
MLKAFDIGTVNPMASRIICDANSAEPEGRPFSSTRLAVVEKSFTQSGGKGISSGRDWPAVMGEADLKIPFSILFLL